MLSSSLPFAVVVLLVVYRTIVRLPAIGRDYLAFLRDLRDYRAGR